ncbi:MAG: preprotein translocase subunit SecY [Clostridiales bacterium]|nr:preprotein translocase subunit SecY [Clostridiales bacterium]
MLGTLKNAFRIPDLRKKLLFTVLILILYRLGAQIPVPFVSAEALQSFATAASGSLFEYFNLLSGDAFSHATLFALSITPYITASIVIQLLTIAIPALERMAKDGDEGPRKINRITRYLTVALSLITSYGYYRIISGSGYNAVEAVENVPSAFIGVVIVASYCAGASLIMWMAERINEFGIGNGISLILFVNIISRLPAIFSQYVLQASSAWTAILITLAVIVVLVVVIFFVLEVTNAERRLPVQYAKKVVGRKMYGGQNTTLPIKVNMNGVMPIIFASSIVSLPTTIATLAGADTTKGIWHFFSYESWFYSLIYFLLIIAFAYFYSAISFNPVEVANNLKKNGGFILGIRAGKPTADYIKKILNKITLIGAIFLSIISVVPLIINMFLSSSVSILAFSGSSLLIVVGVVQETARDIEAQMTLRHYKGFLD